MARIRTIKPEFWTDEKIVQLPYLTRLLFIGLWNFADDFGYLSDEPNRIKMQIMPSDPIDAESEIDLLIAMGLLNRFIDSDGKSFLGITHFSDHQKVDHPTKSKIFRDSSRKLAIPPSVRRELAKKYGCNPGESKKVECYYCGEEGHIYWHQTTHGKPSSWVSFSHEIDHLISENKEGQTTCDNLVLACRSCNRSKGTKDFTSAFATTREPSRAFAPEGKGKERNINPCASSDDDCADNEKSNSLYTKQFLAFWELYPRKKSKGDAAKAFSKVPKSEYPAVRAGIESAMKSPEWIKNGGEFIPYPASWLRARGWEDEIWQDQGKPFDVNQWMRERNAA